QTDPGWTIKISAIEVTVSRDEPDTPPSAITTPEGKRNLGDQQEYLSERLPAYREIAMEVANRVLNFFKYQLHTPMVREIPRWEQGLYDVTWHDAASTKLVGPFTV